MRVSMCGSISHLKNFFINFEKKYNFVYESCDVTFTSKPAHICNLQIHM